MIPFQRVASKKRTNGVRLVEQKEQLRKVSSFVMSVIEAASGSGSGSCSGSSCPTSPSPPQSNWRSSPASNIATSSQKSFEVVVESALGSLGSLSSILLLPTVKEEDEGKSIEKEEELRKRRRRRRKKSSLKPLTPQDLGHLRITEVDESEERLVQHEENEDDHLSSFHLRNPIPIFVQLEDRPIMAFNVDQEEVEEDLISSSETTLLKACEEPEIEEPTVEKDATEITSRDFDDDKVNSNSEPEQKVEGEEDDGSKKTQDEQLVLSSAEQNLREIGDGSLLNHLDHDDVDRHLRVDHYHHHSHHHYYHHNHDEKQEGKKIGAVEFQHLHDNRDDDPLFLTQVHDNDDKHEDLNSPHLCPTCPSIIKTTKGYTTENDGDLPFFPLPHDLHDLSFYSRFSATTRQRALLSNSNRCSNSNLLNDSLKKRQKSRSTPINLDAIALKSASSPHGCPYCSFPCTCCCDECCCARQLSHSTSPQPPPPPPPPPEEQDEEEFITKKKSSSFSGKGNGVMGKSMRSRSMETFSFDNHDDNDYSDGDMEHQDFLTATHLLNHHMPILSHGCHLTPSSTVHLQSDTDDDDDDVNHEKKNVSSHDFLSVNTKTKKGEDKRNGVVQSSMQQTSTSSSSVARRDTQLVIIRKKQPSLSARNGEDSPQQRQRQSQLRVANGEIRSTSSPISNSLRKDENEREVGARMTVRMDTMSLFLDAVHLQMGHAD